MSELIGKIISGRYQVESFLGKGGMAEVYKVWDTERNVHLAMKVLHADLAEDRVFLRRFKREADTLATLQHPNIVRFYGLEQDDDLVYMLMDYVDGTTLRKEIFQAKESLSLERIQEIMRSVCAALYYAHKSGFVHCDVKPANIMIYSNGIVYVSDFGISRMTEASTATMVGAGTPAYMSPEQIKGDDPTPQMDIYALGIVLFEMLTGGERPFTGENAKTTGTTSEKVRWEQLRMAAPPPSFYNPAITPSIDAIVLKCLDKSPANRYLNAMDLYGDLTTQNNTPAQPKPAQSPALEPPIRSPIPEQPQYAPALQGKAIKPQATNRNRLVMGIGAVVIGVLCIAMIIAGSTVSAYQKNIRATGTAEANNMLATGTQQAEYIFATATKQEQSARATATKQEQNVRATATKHEQIVQATATAETVLEMVPNEILSNFGQVTFFENFDENNGWLVNDAFDDDVFQGSLKISSGKYIHNVENIKQKDNYLLTEDLPTVPTVKDFYFQADMLRINGSGAWSCYGLRFRETGESAYYFEVCDDRFYTLSAYVNGTGWITLRDWTHSSKILSGEINRLGVSVKDNRIDLYINGVKIYSLESSYILLPGKQGIMKALYSNDPVIYEFDNVILMIP